MVSLCSSAHLSACSFSSTTEAIWIKFRKVILSDPRNTVLILSKKTPSPSGHKHHRFYGPGAPRFDFYLRVPTFYLASPSFLRTSLQKSMDERQSTSKLRHILYSTTRMQNYPNDCIMNMNIRQLMELLTGRLLMLSFCLTAIVYISRKLINVFIQTIISRRSKKLTNK